MVRDTPDVQLETKNSRNKVKQLVKNVKEKSLGDLGHKMRQNDEEIVLHHIKTTTTIKRWKNTSRLQTDVHYKTITSINKLKLRKYPGF